MTLDASPPPSEDKASATELFQKAFYIGVGSTVVSAEKLKGLAEYVIEDWQKKHGEAPADNVSPANASTTQPFSREEVNRLDMAKTLQDFYQLCMQKLPTWRQDAEAQETQRTGKPLGEKVKALSAPPHSHEDFERTLFKRLAQLEAQLSRIEARLSAETATAPAHKADTATTDTPRSAGFTRHNSEQWGPPRKKFDNKKFDKRGPKPDKKYPPKATPAEVEAKYSETEALISDYAAKLVDPEGKSISGKKTHRKGPNSGKSSTRPGEKNKNKSKTAGKKQSPLTKTKAKTKANSKEKSTFKR